MTTLYREIDALGGLDTEPFWIGYNHAITNVLKIMERRGFPEFVEAVPSNISDIDRVRDAVAEFIECARLRGDNDLPHPCDDPKLWTARMIDAWGELEAVADEDPLAAIARTKGSEA